MILATGSDMAGTVTQDAWSANTVAAVNANQINTWVAAGAGSVEVTGVQLEVGEVTSPIFEHRSYGDELQRCRRYYQQHNRGGAGNCVSSSQIDFNPVLYPDMRASPTVGQTGVISMNGDNADKTQTSTGLTDFGGDNTSRYIRLNNFSSTTAWRTYLFKFLNTNVMTYSAEL